jgi:alanyl-tRNA synthetase
MAENRQAYPYLSENADYISKVIRVEEERFSKTIEQGMDMLNAMMDEVLKKQIANGDPMIPGEEVFKLYDTFGFPFDLTMEIAADKGINVDEEGFLRFMHQQRERARKAWEEQGGAAWEEDVTAGSGFEDKFTGYTELAGTTDVLELVRDSAIVDEICEGHEAVIFLAETPFYAESGGQVGDTGIINVGKSIFKVTDCRKSPTGHIMHIGIVLSGFIAKGDRATVRVDRRRRRAIMRNHTAAHLLQAALRRVLGEHVHQAGSMVNDEVCRFDFTHFSAVSPEQLRDVETKVNDMIMRAIPVATTETTMDEAKAMGAIALFGDKYGDTVRVCNVEGASVELCGGTHVPNTSWLGLFKIISESSVAAGVRRIEATTGRGVLAQIADQEKILNTLSAAFKVTGPAELETKALSVMAQIKSLQKEVEALGKKLNDNQISALTDRMDQIGPVRFVSAVLEGGTADTVKASADSLKDRYPDIVGVFAFGNADKISLLVFAGKDAVSAGIHAGKLVKEIAAITGGSGGGRPDNAMGGAVDTSKVQEALAGAGKLAAAQVKA